MEKKQMQTLDLYSKCLLHDVCCCYMTVLTAACHRTECTHHHKTHVLGVTNRPVSRNTLLLNTNTCPSNVVHH